MTQPDEGSHDAEVANKRHENALACYSVHLEHRKEMTAALLEVSGRYTQWSLTLSGGALALTITYIENIKPLIERHHWILLTSWFALAASIMCSLISLHCSVRATEEAIVNNDRSYINREKNPDALFAMPVNTFGEWTSYLSHGALLTFAFGIFSFCIFVFLCPLQQSDSPNHGQSSAPSSKPKSL